MGIFPMFCSLLLLHVVSVVSLVIVFVWLDSEFFSVLVVIDVCEVVYMMLYMVWDIYCVVMGVLYVHVWIPLPLLPTPNI